MGVRVRHVLSAQAGVAVAASGNQYFPGATGPLVVGIADANCQVTYFQSGKITNLRVYVTAGNRSTGDPGVCIRRNGTDSGVVGSALSVNFAPGGVAMSVPGAKENTSGSVTVAAGDTIQWHLIGGGSGNSNWTISMIEWDFEADDGSAITHLVTCSAGFATTAANTNHYRVPSSNISTANTTRVNGDWKVRLPAGLTARVTHLETMVSANARVTSDTYIYILRNAGGTGDDYLNTVYSHIGPVTGQRSMDGGTMNSVDLVDGDLLTVSMQTGAGIESITFCFACITIRSDDGLWFLVCGDHAAPTQNTTNSKFPLGGLLASTTTEAKVQAKMTTAVQARLLSAFVVTSGAGTLALRAGAADTGTPATESVATNPGASTWTTDTANIDVTADGDLMNTNWTRTANMSVTCIAVTMVPFQRTPEPIVRATVPVRRAASW